MSHSQLMQDTYSQRLSCGQGLQSSYKQTNSLEKKNNSYAPIQIPVPRQYSNRLTHLEETKKHKPTSVHIGGLLKVPKMKENDSNEKWEVTCREAILGLISTGCDDMETLVRNYNVKSSELSLENFIRHVRTKKIQSNIQVESMMRDMILAFLHMSCSWKALLSVLDPPNDVSSQVEGIRFLGRAFTPWRDATEQMLQTLVRSLHLIPKEFEKILSSTVVMGGGSTNKMKAGANPGEGREDGGLTWSSSSSSSSATSSSSSSSTSEDEDDKGVKTPRINTSWAQVPNITYQHNQDQIEGVEELREELRRYCKKRSDEDWWSGGGERGVGNTAESWEFTQRKSVAPEHQDSNKHLSFYGDIEHFNTQITPAIRHKLITILKSAWHYKSSALLTDPNNSKIINNFILQPITSIKQKCKSKCYQKIFDVLKEMSTVFINVKVQNKRNTEVLIAANHMELMLIQRIFKDIY